ncbi:phage tail protein [Saccharibacter sp. EH611]|uniref:phage tail sheath subtilisin-like domain-containing protein n=1 Tax=unclassified Saccharibacter TaxID=2648722 RepID=UPI0013289AB3|nr:MULTISPECIES: phage tail sheath subtilisin-like domain-containing protein [unclassified Saccharibacter]MXV35646.1 phage tail protein [Saccharibacter sp. EH611]MXV65742.1 phage tail protein [Saccharibacter sp. EH60]
MSSAISIPGYDTSNRVPGFYFALDNSKANTAAGVRRVLLIGQKLKNAPGTANVAVKDTGLSNAIASYGDGSHIALMLAAYRQTDPSGEVWLLPLDDDEGASHASATLTLNGQATEAGTLPLYVNDTLISVPVANGDTAQAVAQSIVVRFNQTAGLPVTVGTPAKGNDGTISLTFTAKNAGLTDNQHSLAVALLGSSGGQSVPNGLTVTTTAFTSGAQNPQLPSVFATQGSRVYDLLIHPYSDEASLTAFRDWTNNLSGRWSPMQQLYGQAITAARLTYGQATALVSKNDPHQSIMPTSDSPSHPAKWAAWLGGAIALSMRDNPALPVAGITLPALPPSGMGEFDRDQRNSLLHDGLSTFRVSDDGSVIIERVITTYTENANGLPDNSYLDIERLLTAQVCLQDMGTFVYEQCGNSILLQNGSRIPAGVRAVTPDIVANTIKARYRTQCDNLWCQNPAQFNAGLSVEYAGEGVLKTLMPYIFADQLWTIAGNAQFLASS